MKKYVLAIDQGTTSTRAILVDKSGRALYRASRPLDCIYPQPGWVEVNADRLFVSVVDVINEVLIVSGARMEEIDSIGITNQRETTVVWDRKSGRAIYNAIVWQSKQTLYLCEERKQYQELIKSKTGLLMNPYFSASKIRYILDHVPGAQEKAERGELCAGTVDCWLIYQMTRKEVFASDHTNLSRTLLFDIHKLDYDEELLKIWNIPRCMLPTPKSNCEDYGEASFFEGGVHITGVVGDQQGALFGQGCQNPGEGKNTYGTGCFMLMNTGEEVVDSKLGLLSTVASTIGGKTKYALEGSVFIGGAIIQWLRDEMRLIVSSEASEEYAMRKPDSAGVYFVPSFVGMGTPYWDDEARGAIFGLTRGVDRHNLVRAAIEAIAYQSTDVIKAMEKESNLRIKELRVDGGASANGLLMQFQADLLDAKIALPGCLETTALGAAYLAGLSTGFFSSLEEVKNLNQIAKIYEPKMDEEERRKRYNGWLKAVEATRVFKP